MGFIGLTGPSLMELVELISTGFYGINRDNFNLELVEVVSTEFHEICRDNFNGVSWN